MATCGRVCELAQQRWRFGYRRLHILLRREGITINRKKTQRLYREEGLTVRRRRDESAVSMRGHRPPVLALPNQRWSLDFVHDQFATGRRFRIRHRRRRDPRAFAAASRPCLHQGLAAPKPIVPNVLRH